MDTVYIARVIALHEFDGVAYESAHPTYAKANAAANVAWQDIVNRADEEWRRSYRIEIESIPFTA